MKDLSKSSFMFDLIEEYQIFSSQGDANVLTDEDFASFCNKYKAESVKRDAALYQYVSTTPSFSRCHLPFSKWTLSMAFNVVWYYDELIINDPILDTINSSIADKEQNKYRMQELLKFVVKFKETIKGGYILFAGNDIVPSKTGQFQNASEELLHDSQVLEWFEKYTVLGQKPAPINTNTEDNLTHLLAQYEGMWGENSTMGMYIPPHILNSGKLTSGIMYDFMTPFKRLTRDELISLGKIDILTGLQKEYIKDISVVLEALTNAQRLKTPVLFYRDVDRVVAQQYAIRNSSNSSSKLIANTSVYDCSLPYVEGIPPERLFDARTEIPTAFKEFRIFLHELVSKT
jgi:hypothetical protein